MTRQVITSILFAISLMALSCSTNFYLSEAHLNTEQIDAQDPDPKIENYIAPFREELDKEMGQVIGYCETVLKKELPEGTLGNWVADALLDYAQSYSNEPVHFAVQNYGGLRINSINPGPVTRGKIYELMPFDNMLILIDLPGDIMKLFLENMAGRGGWPVSKGFFMLIENGKPKEVRIQGEPFDESKTYRIALPDYVANGGDRCYFFKELEQFSENKLIRDVLIEAVIKEHKLNKGITSSLENRIQ